VLDSQGGETHKRKRGDDGDGAGEEGDWVDPEVFALQQEGAQTPLREVSNYVGAREKTPEVWDPEEGFVESVFASAGTNDKEKGQDRSKSKKDAKKARRKETQRERLASKMAKEESD
jgi:hypothetical protein